MAFIFIRCDFVGAYQIKLKGLENCTFEDCRFSGIVNWGRGAKNISYRRCGFAGESNILDFSGSLNKNFEDCQFVGTSPDNNHWGAFGSRGDATFKKCTAKWFALVGYTQLTLNECDVTDVEIGADSKANSGERNALSVVKIANSKLHANFSMRAENLRSLTVQDSTLDLMDLRDASVEGDMVLERIQGGIVRGYVKQAGGLKIRNCKILGDGQNVFDAFAGGIKTIEIDGTIFGSGSQKGGDGTDGVTIAGGTGSDLSKPKPRVTDRLTIRNSTIPQLNMHHVQAVEVRIENSDIGEANLNSNLVDTLKLDAARFTGTLDLSHTRVRDFKQGSGTDLAKLGSRLKREGSSITLPR